MNRRSFLGAALGLVAAPIWGLNSKAKGADRVMSKDIVIGMLIVGLVFLGVIVLGELSKALAHLRRRD